MITRVLIVGLGSIGKRHLSLSRKFLPDADVRILRHQHSSYVKQGTEDTFSTIEQALAFAPQLAVIANPSSLHMNIALPLAKAGVHLLIEKPVADSFERVEELIEIAYQQKIVLLVGYNLRFLPSLQTFRELISQNIIGRVLSVRCEIGQYLPLWRPDTDYRHSVSARKELGGGVLLELSHEIDYLRWIFGEVDWVTAIISKQSDLEVNVEDSAHLILGFTCSANDDQLIGTLNMDFIRFDTTRCCIAIGEAGSLRWDGLKGSIESFDVVDQSWRNIYQYQHQRDESYLSEWEHMIYAIENDAPPLVSGEDGLAVLKIIYAAREASRRKCQMHVNNIQMMEPI